jgi:hypothetical protein
LPYLPKGVTIAGANGTYVPLQIRPTAIQVANLTDWENSTGNLLLSVNNVGFLQNSGTTTGLFNIPGSVGINDNTTIAATSAAYPALAVSATTGQAAFLVDQNDTGGDLIAASAGGTSKFVVSKTGYVGIGTDNPLSALDVYGGDGRIGGQYDGHLYFYRGGGAGQVGIVGEYGSQMSISSAVGKGIHFQSNGTNTRAFLHSSGGLAFGDSYYSSDPGANNLTVEGKVGIGTTSPSQQLEVVGSATISGTLE